MARRRIYPSASPTIDKDAFPPRSAPKEAFPPRVVGTTHSRLVLRLALEADVDPRSARRALEEGAASVRGAAGERLALAAEKLGVALPLASAPSSPSAA